MDLKAAVVVVCLCAILITSTKGNYPDKGETPEIFCSEDGFLLCGFRQVKIKEKSIFNIQ